MGFKENSGSENTQYVKIVAPKKGVEDWPYFSIKVLQDGSYVELEKKPNAFEGYLVEAEHDEFEYEGDTIPTVKLTFRDENFKYVMEAPFNMLTRSIVNSLCNVKDFSKEIKIQLYKSDTGFNSASIKEGGERVGWKWHVSKVNDRKIVHKTSTKEVIDWGPVDEFYKTAIDDVLRPALKGATDPLLEEGGEPTGANLNPDKSEMPPPSERPGESMDPDEEDDLPF